MFIFEELLEIDAEADMREVWKRLGDKGRTIYGKRENEWRYTQHGQIVGGYFCGFTGSAMQGCKQ